LLVVLAGASLGGFAFLAGSVLSYDARVYSVGPLAGYSRLPLENLWLVPLVLGPVIFSVATWRFGVVGALVAFAGYAIVGTLLAEMSPLGNEPSVRAVCCDGVRSFMFIGAAVVGIGLLFVVMPITLVARWAWRRFRPASRAPT
jgi:hypothetical protein